MIHTSFCKVTTCCPTFFPSHALKERICSYQTWLTLIVSPFSNFCLQAACPIYSSSFLRKRVPKEVRVSKLSFSFISSILQITDVFTDCLLSKNLCQNHEKSICTMKYDLSLGSDWGRKSKKGEESCYHQRRWCKLL